MRPRHVMLLGAMAIASVVEAQRTGPVWAKPDLFWYVQPVTGGMVWMQVDAKTGSHELLFDHTRMASDLSTKLETRFTSLTLPFSARDAHFMVRFDGSNNAMQYGAKAVEFVYGGQLWRCDLQGEWDWPRASDYYCEGRGAFDRVDEGLGDAAPRVSPDGKWEALVVNNNVVVRRAGTTATTALSTDGTPAFAYYAGSLHWSADAKTLSAYRVNSAIWTTSGVGATVKQFLTRAEWPVR